MRTTLVHLDYYLPILLEDMTKRGYIIQDNKKFYVPEKSMPGSSRQSRNRKKKSQVTFSPSSLLPPRRGPISPGVSSPNLRKEYAEEDYYRRLSPSTKNHSGMHSDYDPNKKFARKGCRTKLPRHKTAATRNNLSIKPRRGRKKPVLLDVDYSRSRSARSRYDEMADDDEYYSDDVPGKTRIKSEYNKYRYTYT